MDHEQNDDGWLDDLSTHGVVWERLSLCDDGETVRIERIENVETTQRDYEGD